MINCAALLYLHNKADTYTKAAKLAADVLASGKALDTLSALIKLSNQEISLTTNNNDTAINTHTQIKAEK
ncbi:MAG: anthranilate phosphoribosyltransferase [Colwellia sp.]